MVAAKLEDDFRLPIGSNGPTVTVVTFQGRLFPRCSTTGEGKRIPFQWWKRTNQKITNKNFPSQVVLIHQTTGRFGSVAWGCWFFRDFSLRIQYTPPKLTAKAPENRPFHAPRGNETSLPSIHFQVLLLLVLGRVNVFPIDFINKKIHLDNF